MHRNTSPMPLHTASPRYASSCLALPRRASVCLILPRYASSCSCLPCHFSPCLTHIFMPRPNPLPMISCSLTVRSPPRLISIVAPPYFSPALHHIVKPRQIKHCWHQRPIKPAYTNLSYQSQPAYPTPTPITQITFPRPALSIPQHTSHS